MTTGFAPYGDRRMHLTQGLSRLDSFHWTVVTISTTGYEDIVPVTF
jgi:hypothetical protein